MSQAGTRNFGPPSEPFEHRRKPGYGEKTVVKSGVRLRITTLTQQSFFLENVRQTPQDLNLDTTAKKATWCSALDSVRPHEWCSAIIDVTDKRNLA
jgi:hypothetical protein